MISVSKKTNSILIGLVAGILSASPVMADDTEIYLGATLGLPEVNPNILFVIDNSGSMDTLVSSQETYDPSQTYSGSCDPNRVYWTSGNSQIPTSSCGNYFDLSSMQCEAAIDAFATGGQYQDRAGQYRNNQWRSISSTDHSNDVECREDRGDHGNGGSETYAAHGWNGGPWKSSSNNSVRFSRNEGYSTYTFRTGNFRNWQLNAGGQDKTRLEIVKDAVYEVVNGLGDVNIGLMHFDDDIGSGDSYDGGLVAYAMEDVATARTAFLNTVDNLSPDTYTPLGETMYEAALYYRGDSVYYGNKSEPIHSVSASRSLTNPNVYKTPITSECQQNFIVYLTDGDPTEDNDVSSTMMSNIDAGNNCDYGTGSYQSNCLDDIALALKNNDQNTSLDENQTVTTYTIGFGTGMSNDGISLLESTANAGGGEYYPANDTSSLINAFTSIVGSILQVNATFSSPAVSVNAFSRTEHLNHLYFSLFRPDYGSRWDGNFKRYQLNFDTDGIPTVVDVNNDSAVETIGPSAGLFRDSARSFWTPDSSGWDLNFENADNAPDGKESRKGGAASVLTDSRNVYTNVGSSQNLSDSANIVHENNTVITQAMLGVSTTTDRDDLLKWARGLDVNDEDGDGDVTDPRKVMGDPLHGEPVLVTYGGSSTSPDMTAYVPTNDGYLHAINTIDGTERFAFIPENLLGNLNLHYANSASSTKTYGLDGSVVAWVQYNDPDDLSQGVARAHIYFGMRRGGNRYYAMDVTDRSNPQMLWAIEGGTGDFSELSETWSKPKLRKIRFNGQDRFVLVFAGGYDLNQDNAGIRTADTVGRAVYIVDAETGQRLWWASSDNTADLVLADMQYSIPSEVAVVDTVGDGYANLMYVGDMGGQVWRFDIAKGDSGSSLTSLIKGGRIADLAADNDVSETRRFYYRPEVAIYNYQGKYYIALAIGSGYRAHPLNSDVQDRIYMLRDESIRLAPVSYTTLTNSDLFDTTDNAIGEGTDAEKAAAKTSLSNAKGWYIDLESAGEKSLSDAVIYNGSIYFTTYLPNIGNTSNISCAPREGSGRLYIVQLSDGIPTFSNDPTLPDDKSKVNRFNPDDPLPPGIPSSPEFIQTGDGSARCVGPSCVEDTESDRLTELYWFER